MADNGIFDRKPGRLGIRIPRSAWKAAGHNASAALRQKGMLIRQGILSDWLAEDLTQLDNELICYGPGFEGLGLEELLQSELDETTRIQRLAAVARAFVTLDRGTRLIPGIQAAGILVSKDGDVLILPPALIARTAARAQSFAAPGFDPEPRIQASIMLGRILRHVCVSQSASGSASGLKPQLDNESRWRSDPFVPLNLISPRLDPRLAALADKTIRLDSSLPSLDDWAKAFDEAGRKKYRREVSEEELSKLELQRQAAEARVNKKIAHRRFLSKRGGILAGLSIIAIAVAFIAIFDRPSPGPDLSELSPEALVRTYYSAISNLDLETVDACLKGKAGKDDISLVSHLTIVMKMRQAYAQESALIKAEDWISSGSPELEAGSLMYGITELAVRNLDQVANPAGQNQAAGRLAIENEASKVNESWFEAQYTLWTTESGDDGIHGIHIRRTDQLILAKGKKGWKIIVIERENV